MARWYKVLQNLPLPRLTISESGHMPNPSENDRTKREEHDVYMGGKAAKTKPSILSNLAKTFKDYELSRVGGRGSDEHYAPGNHGWYIPGDAIQERDYPEKLPEPDHVVEKEE